VVALDNADVVMEEHFGTPHATGVEAVLVDETIVSGTLHKGE
jgi:hypothetical protein